MFEIPEKLQDHVLIHALKREPQKQCFAHGGTQLKIYPERAFKGEEAEAYLTGTSAQSLKLPLYTQLRSEIAGCLEAPALAAPRRRQNISQAMASHQIIKQGKERMTECEGTRGNMYSDIMMPWAAGTNQA